jgi:diguanylate cyclase (GGDEF)-like protein
MIDEVAQRILLIIEKPFILHGNEHLISASVGIAIYPEDGETLEILIKHADVAMYQSKKTGRNKYSYYQSNIESGSLDQGVLAPVICKAKKCL